MRRWIELRMIVAVQNPSPNAKLGTLSVHPQLHIFSKISDQRVPSSPNNLSTVSYSISLPKCVCVCVDHLKRCKTSYLLDDVLQWFSNLTLPFWLFHLIFQQKQGVKAFSDYLAQRSYVTEGEATGDAQLCTCR